jgi:gas vesicle protein
MRSFFSFLSGVLSGAVVGIAAALLLAPSSGNKLRGNLRSRYGNVLTDIKTSVASERKRLEEELESLRHGEIRLS